MGGAGGYRVQVDALHKYVGDLGKYHDQTGKIKDLVGKADVGDKSWGVVGIFTKHGYDETLHQLQSLMDAVNQGLQTAAAKLTTAANVYQGTEDDHVEFFNGIKVLLDGPEGDRS
jgi:uncharacterized protein YukE